MARRPKRLRDPAISAARAAARASIFAVEGSTDSFEGSVLGCMNEKYEKYIISFAMRRNWSVRTIPKSEFRSLFLMKNIEKPISSKHKSFSAGGSVLKASLVDYQRDSTRA